MSHSNKSISPLRQRMIDDITLRKISPKTQSGHCEHLCYCGDFCTNSSHLGQAIGGFS